MKKESTGKNMIMGTVGGGMSFARKIMTMVEISTKGQGMTQAFVEVPTIKNYISHI